MGLGEIRAFFTEKIKPGLLSMAALTAILMLGGWLRLANLSVLGLANHYYAAAVKSMLESWSNFFFVAAEPGGSVSVDKPPVGLWLQAVSAKIFGVTTFGLLLPQIIAGLLSIILLYYLVKRHFGVAAGLLSALVLAITPVAVATDRNNTMDSTLIFTLLLAAWAFIRAAETARLKFLLIGAGLVGIAFNIKMLEAYLPLPAFLLVYLVGAQEGWWPKLGKLLLTVIVLLVVSLSWAVAVDLTPADNRPYVGSSGDNSEISLILGYNGIERLSGLFTGQSPPPTPQPDDRTQAAPGQIFIPIIQAAPPGGFQPILLGSSNRAGASGVIDGIGQPGALRLFVPPLSKEASWLLPLGLFGLLAVGFNTRLTWPLGSQHQSAILWGGWLVTAGVFFSIAGFFHEYYLDILAPPLAALVGIGVVQAWRASRVHPWLASGLIIAVTALTLFQQYLTADTFLGQVPWLPWIVAISLMGALSIIFAELIPRLAKAGLAQVGFIGLVAAMLVTPAIWSGQTNLHPSTNQSLPAAYDGRSNGPVNSGALQVDMPLLAYLQSNTQGMFYLMAVPSAMQGADYVLSTGRPVLYLGGFLGQDEVLTPQQLAGLVAGGKLRFIYWSIPPGGSNGAAAFAGQSVINNWVSSHCRVVEGYHAFTGNLGGPDGTPVNPGNNRSPGAAEAVTLYDCGK